jgi:hypothetical protein
MSKLRYLSTQTEGETLERPLRVLEILSRRGCVAIIREQSTRAGGEGDFNLTERVQILIVEGARAFGLDGLEPTLLGEAPELF